MKVLYIEDSAGNIRVMRIMARVVDFELHTARSGHEGLAMLDASYDLLLLDNGLPDGSGLALIARFRQKRPRLPVILITGCDVPGDRERCLAAGCTDYVSKPFDVEAMMALLRRYRAEG